MLDAAPPDAASAPSDEAQRPAKAARRETMLLSPAVRHLAASQAGGETAADLPAPPGLPSAFQPVLAGKPAERVRRRMVRQRSSAHRERSDSVSPRTRAADGLADLANDSNGHGTAQMRSAPVAPSLQCQGFSRSALG